MILHATISWKVCDCIICLINFLHDDAIISEGCQHVEDLHHKLHLVSVVNCDANVKWSRWVSDMGAFLSTMITKSNQCRHNLTDPHAWAQYDVSNRMTLGYQLTFTNSTHIVSSHHKTTHLKYNYLCIIFSWWLGTLVYINGGHCLYCCGGTLSLFQLQLRRLQIPIQCLLWKSWKLLLVPDAFGTSKLHSCIWKKKVLS